jgi:hypothetical protein
MALKFIQLIRLYGSHIYEVGIAVWLSYLYSWYGCMALIFIQLVRLCGSHIYAVGTAVWLSYLYSWYGCMTLIFVVFLERTHFKFET